ANPLASFRQIWKRGSGLTQRKTASTPAISRLRTDPVDAALVTLARAFGSKGLSLFSCSPVLQRALDPFDGAGYILVMARSGSWNLSPIYREPLCRKISPWYLPCPRGAS